MKKQLRRTFWGMLIVLAVVVVVGLTAGPGWASTTGVRIVVENESSDKTFVVEYVPSDNPGHDVEILKPNDFVHFSDEATAWVATSKTYRYKIKVYPTVELGSPSCTVNLTLKNVWAFGPKVEYCGVQVEPGVSDKTRCRASTYKNNRCNLKVQIGQ